MCGARSFALLTANLMLEKIPYAYVLLLPLRDRANADKYLSSRSQSQRAVFIAISKPSSIIHGRTKNMTGMTNDLVASKRANGGSAPSWQKPKVLEFEKKNNVEFLDFSD